MPDGNTPAFPSMFLNIRGDYEHSYGLTKREEFAKAAMVGMLVARVAQGIPFTKLDQAFIADVAVMQADALLAELARGDATQ